MVDADGMVIRSCYTENPDAGVYEGCRLLPDIIPTINAASQSVHRIEPVPKDAQAIPYEIRDVFFSTATREELEEGVTDPDILFRMYPEFIPRDED